MDHQEKLTGLTKGYNLPIKTLNYSTANAHKEDLPAMLYYIISIYQEACLHKNNLPGTAISAWKPVFISSL